MSKTRRKIGIIGSGALGCYFGIRLAAGGEDVIFLMRSNLDQARSEGLRLRLASEEKVELPQINCTDQVENMGELDIVLVAIKTTANDQLGGLLKPLVGKSTIIVTVQNGLGNIELLQSLFPGNPVVGVLCQIGVNRVSPVEIKSFVPGDGFVQIGQGEASGKSALSLVETILKQAGITTKLPSSIGEAIWRKLMWNVPFNGLTVAVGGVGTDVICSDPRLRKIAHSLMEEIRMAANTLGYEIEAEYTEKLLQFTDKLGAYKASSVLDWNAGKPLETAAIWDNPLEAGRKAGINMPHLETLAAILNQLSRRNG